MAGYTPAAMADLHGALGDTYFDFALHQLIRHRVRAAFSLDMVVDADALLAGLSSL